MIGLPRELENGQKPTSALRAEQHMNINKYSFVQYRPTLPT